jgi:Uma2 family endonuclease
MRLELDLPDKPMTAEDFERIPWVRGVRLELWEGNLIVAAAAQMKWHSMVARRIETWFRDQGRDAEREVGVVVAHRDVPSPDVTVFREPVRNPLRSQFPAADVACCVEVVSPESEERDHLTKPGKYAAAGIPEFWLVEQHPDDAFDAIIKQHKLSAAGGYDLVRTITLSDLEEE